MTEDIIDREAVARAEAGEFVDTIQGVASFCETCARDGGASPEDLAIVIAKLRDAAFVIDQQAKHAKSLRAEVSAVMDKADSFERVAVRNYHIATTEHALGFKAGIEAGARLIAGGAPETSGPDYGMASEDERRGMRERRDERYRLADLISSLPTPPSPLPEILEAMKEAETVFKLVETPAFHDPDFQREIEALGRRIGFGALMSGAEAAWRDANAEKGTPPGSEFVAGPCRSMVTAVLTKLRGAIAKFGGKIDAG